MNRRKPSTEVNRSQYLQSTQQGATEQNTPVSSVATRKKGGFHAFGQSIDHKADLPYPKNRPRIDLAA
jgi:hypothetical protein